MATRSESLYRPPTETGSARFTSSRWARPCGFAVAQTLQQLRADGATTAVGKKRRCAGPLGFARRPPALTSPPRGTPFRPPAGVRLPEPAPRRALSGAAHAVAT